MYVLNSFPKLAILQFYTELRAFLYSLLSLLFYLFIYFLMQKSPVCEGDCESFLLTIQ